MYRGLYYGHHQLINALNGKKIVPVAFREPAEGESRQQETIDTHL